jgi:LysM repeat protein
MKFFIGQFACAWILLFGSITVSYAATYTVKPGDSLSKIARSHGCTVESLAKANGIKLSAIIQAGQTLKLPGKATTTVGSGYTIQPGDTLSRISRKYGISVEALLAANPGLNPNSLKPGQKISLAATSGQSTRTKPAPPKNPTPEKTASAPVNSTNSAVKQATQDAPAAAQAEKPSEASSEVKQHPLEEKILTVMVNEEMTFGDFANRHGSDIARLNELNGLDLTPATILAKGSELYVPMRVPVDPQR